MKTVIWSAQSRHDLRGIRDYIAQDSEHYSRLQVLRIFEKTEAISKHPMRGHPVHEYPDSGLYEVHSGNYRIIYDDGDEELNVVTIVHMKQRLTRKRLSGS